MSIGCTSKFPDQAFSHHSKERVHQMYSPFCFCLYMIFENHLIIFLTYLNCYMKTGDILKGERSQKEYRRKRPGAIYAGVTKSRCADTEKIRHLKPAKGRQAGAQQKNATYMPVQDRKVGGQQKNQQIAGLGHKILMDFRYRYRPRDEQS